MKLTADGFDELQNNLENVRKSTNSQSTESEVTFDTLFDQGFMARYTPFTTLEEFVISGGFKLESPQDFEGILGTEFDRFISSNTEFDSWDAMFSKAGEVYMADKISTLFK